MLTATKMLVKFAMLVFASSQLSSDQVALTHLDQVVSLPSLDQVVLPQDFARPIPIVTRMLVKFAMLANASCPLLWEEDSTSHDQMVA